MKNTISDIAKMAGVSKATVSRVLNNSKPVSSEVRNKVMHVIEETGFKPSALARGLATKETKLIGVVIPDVANPIFSELVKGMEEEANNSGYNVLLCNTYLDQSKEMQYLQVLKDKEVDGIIFLTTHETEEQVKFFKSFSKPVVTDRKFKQMDLPSVGVNDFEASYEAVNYLINLSHSRIAMVRGPIQDQSHGSNRYLGYIKAMEDNDLEIDETRILEGDFTVKAGYEAMGKLLAVKKSPSAVFFANDLMAVGGIRCIVDSGLQVPEDISVIGFDDIPIASMFIPSLTTVKQPTFEVGIKMMEKVVHLIRGKEDEKHSVFETKLMLRNSTCKHDGS